MLKKDLIFNLHYEMPRGVRYGRWNPKYMERVLEVVQSSDVDLNAASREYPVQTATRKRHLDEKNYFAVENTQVISNRGDIPPRVGEELDNHFLLLGQYMFHITITDL
jgi:hypothetical protein